MPSQEGIAGVFLPTEGPFEVHVRLSGGRYAVGMTKPKKSEGVQLQKRDKAIFRTLLDCRIMTIKHAAGLHFDGSFEAAKKRLHRLKEAGFLSTRDRFVQQPAIYSISRKGYMSLKDEGMLDPLLELGWAKMQERIRVSDMMLAHELAVMDVKGALAPAIAKTENLELVEFSVNPERHAFRATQVILDSKKLVGYKSVLAKPDGFLHVKENKDGNVTVDHYFFLEVDRGTASLKRIVQKIQRYGQYYRNGGFASKVGFPRDDIKRHPFRVLLVVPSVERRNNIAEKLLHTTKPVTTMVWLTTMEKLIDDPMGQIWIRPADHSNAAFKFDLAILNE